MKYVLRVDHVEAYQMTEGGEVTERVQDMYDQGVLIDNSPNPPVVDLGNEKIEMAWGNWIVLFPESTEEGVDFYISVYEDNLFQSLFVPSVDDLF